MTELELLREFFHRWEEFHLLPTGPGRRSKEHEAAAAALIEAAHLIKGFVAPIPQAVPAAAVSQEVNTFRLMQQQVAAMPPKDGFKSGLKS